MKGRLIITFGFLFLLILGFILYYKQSNTGSNTCFGKTETIQANTQATLFNDVKIASGNFWENSAHLWFYFKGRPEQNTAKRVVAGDIVKVDKYRVKAMELDMVNETITICIER